MVLRFIPALAGGATVWLTGMIARRLGADGYGQALAAGAMMIGSIYHVTFGYYSMNAFSALLWALCFWILIEIERREERALLLGHAALPLGHVAPLLCQRTLLVGSVRIMGGVAGVGSVKTHLCLIIRIADERWPDRTACRADGAPQYWYCLSCFSPVL